MKYQNVKFGADPEVFFKDPSGKFISSIGLVGGSKMFPLPIGDGAAVQEDNVAVEFNIAPAATPEEFIRNIYKPLDYLNKLSSGMGLSLAIVPCATFDESELQDDAAKVFGCDPDWDAWSLRVNPKPQLQTDQFGFRTCGGHLHISWADPDKPAAVNLVKSLDLFLGVPSVLRDPDKQRRSLYGKAGAFRYKPYGVEYRTLSNFWIAEQQLMEWVFHQATKAIKFAEHFSFTEKKLEARIKMAINQSREKLAQSLIAEFGVES